MQKYSIITGTGSYLPTEKVPNSSFLEQQFYEANGNPINKPAKEIIEKFQEITEIRERRYVSKDLVVSDIAYFAAREAFESSNINPETIDYIIVAHNFGDVKFDNRKSDMVPSLAARVKHKLGIRNPQTIAFDITFGCPGWLQGIIMADALIRAGNAKKVLIIGAETLSRISDPYDRDSLIYADGAGATILEAKESMERVGILSHAVRSDTLEYAHMLRMDVSYNPNYKDNTLFLKMNGTKLYKYALSFVPGTVKESLDKAGLNLHDVSKLLIHQANAKMDYAILQGLCNLYGVKKIPYQIMPMTIQEFGNSSVATIPTLLDLLFKGKLSDHSIKRGDKIVLASVGAGTNINSLVYEMQEMS
jgi:3-oxoacyl-[acyl-carrier-protein] synthase-3